MVYIYDRAGTFDILKANKVETLNGDYNFGICESAIVILTFVLRFGTVYVCFLLYLLQFETICIYIFIKRTKVEYYINAVFIINNIKRKKIGNVQSNISQGHPHGTLSSFFHPRLTLPENKKKTLPNSQLNYFARDFD